MPCLRIRPMTEEDLGQVTEAWNRALAHDQVSAERLRAAILGDPNYEPGGVVVAEGSDGQVLGMAACIVRRTVQGRDGEGVEWEFGTGYLKGFFLAGGAEEAAASLVGHAEAFCRAAGKTALQLTLYSHNYLYPGLDVRYEGLREVLQALGYRDVATVEDVGTKLEEADIAARLACARARVGPDAQVLSWRPELLPQLRRFVEEEPHPRWFPPGWEQRYQQADETTLVLRRGEEIVGWAHFSPGRPRASFGPTLVLSRERSRGYGGLLLLECMSRARQLGAEEMWAGWANTRFYVRYGWQIVRRYAVLRKELEG